jgi:predicted permease
LAGLAATVLAPMNLSDERHQPERLRGTYVSSETFRLLRVAPVHGRDFLPDDDRPGAPAVAIISYGVWQVLYGGDPSVVGRVVRINDIPATIVGVMPARFGFPAFQDLWQPLALMPGIESAGRGMRRLDVFGRLVDSANLLAARAEIQNAAAQLAVAYPDSNTNLTVSVAPLKDRRPDSGPILMTMMGAVVFVLLIACANVANLLLARSVQRAREIAIRASLGATRWRIVRQLLIECLLVAICAGGLGLLLSVAGVKLLGVAFDVIDVAGPAQLNTPYWIDLSMNAPVFAFVAALCLATGLVFGLVPALHISKTDVHNTLKDGGRGGLGGRRARRWSGVFVAAELALTLVLLTGAGLLWRSFLTLYRQDAIVDVSDLVMMRLGLPVEKYSTPERQQAFFAALDDRLAGRSGVFRATIASYVPYSMSLTPIRQLSLEGRQATPGSQLPSVRYAFAGPRYFETMGLPLIRGRAFGASDERTGEEGAIVDQQFVATFLADEDPIGRRIQLSAAQPPGDTSAWLTIVGVVPAMTQGEPVRPSGQAGPPPMVYVPLSLEPAPRTVALVARRPDAAEHKTWRAVPIGGDPQLSSIVSAIRDEVRALDPDLPVFAIETMDAAMVRARFPNRLMGTWFGILAGIALVLASVGLYALTAHSVASRRQEIGVRMALGAQAREVIWLFLRRSIGQLGIGLALGIAGALATSRLLQSYVLRTDPVDAPTLIVVCAVLVIVSLLACLVPARRAARVDPVTTLREE